MKPGGQRTALVAGPTGLVGSALVARLLATPRYRRIVALSRRPLPVPHARLEVVDARFDALDRALAGVGAADRPLDVFCCLGTTLRTAGSPAAFRRVDHDFVLALGRWAVDAQAHRMVVVSALGADPASRVFYNRAKGETERDLRALGFAGLVLVRPSLLAGERSERRIGERLALRLSVPLRGWLPARVRPIAAVDVAQAMIDAALLERPPALVESAAMQGAADAR